MSCNKTTTQISALPCYGAALRFAARAASGTVVVVVGAAACLSGSAELRRVASA